MADVRGVVQSALATWLAYNKRLDNYEFVVRDVEKLSAKICRATQTSTSTDTEESLTQVLASSLVLEAATDCITGNISNETTVDVSHGIVKQKHIDDMDERIQSEAHDVYPSDSQECLLDASHRSAPNELQVTLPASTKSSLRVTLDDGLQLRSVYVSELDNARQIDHVNITLFAQRPGERSEMAVAEFYGRRAADFSVDEAKYNVDFEAVVLLQSTLAPSLPRPIVFFDLLMSLPIAPVSCSMPFRSRMLEDMLCQECWAEGSDSESDADDQESAFLDNNDGDDRDENYSISANVSHAGISSGTGRKSRRLVQ